MFGAVPLIACSTRTAPEGPPVEEERPDANARTWVLRAEVASALGDRAAAERAWRWAVRMDPGPTTRVRRGWFYWKAGRLDEAKTDFATVLAEFPTHSDGRLGMGAVTGEDRWLIEVLEVRPCRVATLAADPELRHRAEALCVSR